MAVGDAYVFPGFLTPVLTLLFFPKPPTTFLTCFCRGERRKYTGKKSRLNRGSNSQPPGHESDTLTTEPPGRAWPHGDHLNKPGRGSLGDATHIKYQSSMSSSLREDDFHRFCSFFFSFWLPWQPELWMELNSLNNFVELHPRKIPAKFYQEWPSV